MPDIGRMRLTMSKDDSCTNANNSQVKNSKIFNQQKLKNLNLSKH